MSSWNNGKDNVLSRWTGGAETIRPSEHVSCLCVSNDYITKLNRTWLQCLLFLCEATEMRIYQSGWGKHSVQTLSQFKPRPHQKCVNIKHGTFLHVSAHILMQVWQQVCFFLCLFHLIFTILKVPQSNRWTHTHTESWTHMWKCPLLLSSQCESQYQ